MRKAILLTLALIMVASFAYATLEGHIANSRLSSIILQMDSTCRQAGARLGSLKQEGADIVTAQGADLDATDKTKLNAYAALIQDAKDAMDAAIAYKDTNWANLQ